MIKRLSSLALTLMATCSLWAQTDVKYPLGAYDEAVDPLPCDTAEWRTLDNHLYSTWASRDIHYALHEVPSPQIEVRDTTIYVWRGERANMQAILYSRQDQGRLSVTMKGNKGLMKESSARFVNYVLTTWWRTCGYPSADLPSFLVPDVIDIDQPRQVEACEVRPVWCTIEVPRKQKPGTYPMTVEVADAQTGAAKCKLNLNVVVLNRTLPQPKDYSFHLDFWQQPYAISRYYGLKPWSKEHMEALRPYLRQLARAGQKVCSTILFYEPWGEQSHDKFEPMIATTLKADGTWTYDYSVFDNYVKLCAECGITKQISCFSMVPWDMSFRYMDEKSGQYKHLNTQTSSEEYRELWTSFLKSFALHLKKKGWFDKTCIAMDERGLPNMQDAYRVAQEAVPGIKMSLAGNYHTELADILQDYCVAYGQKFKPEEREARRQRGQSTTTYTCCTEAWPNLFTNNNPSDAPFLPLYCAANDFDGYLRWSWMNWAENPLTDSRFRMFAPGDTYIIYPARSSVRAERFIEGIECFEKLRILRHDYAQKGETAKLEALNQMLDRFRTTPSYDGETAILVSQMEALLNEAPMPSLSPIKQEGKALQLIGQ